MALSSLTRRAALAFISGGLVLGLSTDLSAQVIPEDPGSASAALLLRQLDGVKRVLMIGAHPDDEDTSILATLARGWGARAAYLSLTRGEGGQNLIGPELGEGLGVVRTGELLAARRIDGAEQFFTRAYDFGYSKTAEETFAHWPRDSVLADVVWVIRTFRPQIIVSVFGGTPADGHGQHQVAGLVVREAFEAAGDPDRFPEQLDRGVGPWSPSKLYRRTWRDPESSTLAVETGRLDPLLSRSYHQLAMRSRSQHRSQDFGTAELGGPRVTLIRLVESRVAGPDTSLFAGVDTTLAGLAAGLPTVEREPLVSRIRVYRDGIHDAARELNSLQPWRAVPFMLTALSGLRAAIADASAAAASSPELLDALRRRSELLQEAVLAAASIKLVLRASEDIVVPGQTFRVYADLWNAGPYWARTGDPILAAPAGWTVSGPFEGQVRGSTGAIPAPRSEPVEGVPISRRPAWSISSPGVPGPEDARLSPGELATWRFEATVPADFKPSEPYYLGDARSDDLYVWPPDFDLHGLPLDPPLVWGTVRIALVVDAAPDEPPGPDVGSGQNREVWLSLRRPVRYRGVDKAAGEFWRPVLVLPAVSVSVEPRTIIWPAGHSGERTLAVTVHGEGQDSLSGRVWLEAPPGWTVSPAEQTVTLSGPGVTRSMQFRLRPADPRTAEGTGRIRAFFRATDGSDERVYDQEALLIDYSHIEPTLLLRDASTLLRTVDVEVAVAGPVGYVMGSGDEVPEAIRQLGVEVVSIEAEDLAAGGLDPFDVIVLGVRAYEVRPDLVAANEQLLDWVGRGGTLIVQYNKYELPDGGFAPYPVAMRRPHDRVTDEQAEVKILAPNSIFFNTPNSITSRDFDGWVQERGLYMLSEWDDRFTPLLATADAGEEPKQGGLLVAPVGDGLYVYVALSLFRQLPAGVPGAYRLLANLLSLEPSGWSTVPRVERDDQSPGR